MSVCVVGSFVQDLSFKTSHFPSPGETRIGSFKTGPGGKGFNQAVASARQAVDTSFIGAVGDDVFGAGARAFAEKENIDARLDTVVGQASGAASIVVGPGAENMIVVALGANAELSPSYIRNNQECIVSADILVCQLECSLSAVQAAFAEAKNGETRIILNPAPINEDLDRELISEADILVPNESELLFLAEKFVGVGGVDFSSDDQLRDICRSLGLKSAVVTLGEAGSFVFEAESPQARRVSSIKVKAVDTTGAGDAFCGGLAAALSRGAPDLYTAAVEASVVAALSVTKEGTAPAMPSRDEVQAAHSKLA